MTTVNLFHHASIQLIDTITGGSSTPNLDLGSSLPGSGSGTGSGTGSGIGNCMGSGSAASLSGGVSCGGASGSGVVPPNN
ncbi:hypothetical protein [Nocardia sp. NBC_01327]|uniref:hypothetical protein n=1 Tax=Nocardia sp. NBC_01327 TaxID=2903593 RepID=UPI002E1671AB|nr:hypothetical protein OG326_05560 [Nocardia sp. NBC_01327]